MPAMFRRRDLPSLLFLFTVITMLLLTLCQILVVHRYEMHIQNSKHTSTKATSKQQSTPQQNNVTNKRKIKETVFASSFRNSKIMARTELFRRKISKLILESIPKNSSEDVLFRRKFLTKNVNNVMKRDNYKKQNTNIKRNLCPLEPPNLDSDIFSNERKWPHLNMNREVKDFHHLNFTITKVILLNMDLQHGGSWKPLNCSSRHTVAIVIPYRNRYHHLVTFLYFLIPMLKRQMIHFRIFLAEQYGDDIFNKGRLMNAAFLEAKKLFNFDCVIFHDVDLVPEDDRNVYSCPWQPKHLSVAIDEMNYKLKYELLVGGVLNMRKEHFEMVNGYSNNYWGWGGEDDDMAYRILLSGLRITRPPSSIARYKMLRHRKRRPSSFTDRGKLLKSVNIRFQTDGLNNVPYKKIYTKCEKLFTHFMFDVGLPS